MAPHCVREPGKAHRLFFGCTLLLVPPQKSAQTCPLRAWEELPAATVEKLFIKNNKKAPKHLMLLKFIAASGPGIRPVRWVEWTHFFHEGGAGKGDKDTALAPAVGWPHSWSGQSGNGTGLPREKSGDVTRRTLCGTQSWEMTCRDQAFLGQT